ncbi:hypothetical protein AB0E44_13705 [Micrococcus terreus]|uniref:nucleoside-diphosphate sugar epimerase/dehydratase n=1 Tax=Micrococcus terreus TaxID=574650 RepID=UPI0033C197C2
MTELLLLAASGLARETMASIRAAAKLAEASGRPADQLVGLLDDDVAVRGTAIDGVPILGPLDLAAERTEQLLICAGPAGPALPSTSGCRIWVSAAIGTPRTCTPR